MNRKVTRIKFDLHCHTDKSDGKHDIEKMLMGAKKARIKVLAITDHNKAMQELDSTTVYEKYGITLIPGFELSLMRGHILVLGIDPKKAEAKLNEWKLPAKRVAVRVRKKTLTKMLEWSVENGGYVIAAHPCISTPIGFMSLKKRPLAEYFEKGLIHGAEVHNDELERRSPKRLYNLWHKSVLKYLTKLGIPMYVNSDAHSYKRLGTRYNSIMLENPNKLLEILKSGKAEIKHHKKIVKKKVFSD